MPKLDHDTAIKEYYEKTRDTFPNIRYEVFEQICKSPFRFIKAQIRQVDTPIILIKYLGKFKVYASTIKKLIKLNSDRLKIGRIDEEQHKQREIIYKEKLKQLENDKDTDD